MPYGLAIHTSSPDLGLAISNFERDRRSQTWDLGRELSSQLHLRLMDFLAPQTWMDLDFLAVAQGPGGFTGTRVGVVTARTLAQHLDLPLFAVSSLAAVAWMERSRLLKEMPDPPDIAVEMRAQRGELFVAIYSAAKENEWVPLLPDSVMTGDRWQQILENWQTPYHRIQAEGNLGHSTPALLELAFFEWQQGVRPHWSTVLPFYGQSCVPD